MAEYYFNWKCPKCGHRQADSVNPELGPFLNLTCGACGWNGDESKMDSESIAEWDRARDEADPSGDR